LTDLALLPPNDSELFVLIIFVFGTFEDLALVDFTNLDLNDLLALVLPELRLFKTRVFSPISAEPAHDLRLPFPVVSTDLEALILEIGKIVNNICGHILQIFISVIRFDIIIIIIILKLHSIMSNRYTSIIAFMAIAFLSLSVVYSSSSLKSVKSLKATSKSFKIKKAKSIKGKSSKVPKIKASKSVETTGKGSLKSWAGSADIGENTRVLKSLNSGSTKASKSFKSKLVKSTKAKSSKVPKTKIIKTKSSESLGGNSAKSVKARSRRYLKKAKTDGSVKSVKTAKVKSSKIPKIKSAKSVKSDSAKSLKNWSRM
jgi:hypothetical protein